MKKQRPPANANGKHSMQSIADLAGVAKMTVCRALNGSKGVSEVTRQRILKIARDVGYQNSPIMSSVMGQVARSRKIDYSIPIMMLVDWDPNKAKMNPAQEEYLSSAMMKARSLGFRVEVQGHASSRLSDRRINEILETRGIQGVVINVANNDPRELHLNWDRLCAVTTGGRLLNPRHLPRILSDLPQMLGRTLHELSLRGYRRIGFCYAAKVDRILNGFYELPGYFRMFHEYHRSRVGKRQQIPLYEISGSSPEGSFRKWVETYKPDVIVSTFHGTGSWLTEMGISTPGDVGFVSLGVKEMGGDISGMYLSKGSISAIAVDSVINRLMKRDYGMNALQVRTLVPGIWNPGKTIRHPST